MTEPMASTSTVAHAPELTQRKKSLKKSLKPSANAPPLGKFLASSEKHIRDKAVASLSKFLSAGQVKPIKSDEETSDSSLDLPVGDVSLWDTETKIDTRLESLAMAKLWKGIFFCFWMSDKPLVQQALAQDLAMLTLDVRPKDKSAGRVERVRATLAYLRGFWEAVVREWSGIDRYRLDKFYLLIRRFVHAAFLLLKREEWDLHAIREYNQILTGPGGPLHVIDARIPASIGYHLADVYNTEIERCFPTDSSQTDSNQPKFPLLAVLQPFIHTLALAPSKTLFERINETVFTPLLDDSLPAKESARNKRRKIVSEIVKPTYPGIWQNAIAGDVSDKEACGKELVKALFLEGGKPETNEVNRRRLYALVREREAAGVDLEV